VSGQVGVEERVLVDEDGAVGVDRAVVFAVAAGAAALGVPTEFHAVWGDITLSEEELPESFSFE
jgi:hypothetical protein